MGGQSEGVEKSPIIESGDVSRHEIAVSSVAQVRPRPLSSRTGYGVHEYRLSGKTSHDLAPTGAGG